MAKTLKPYTVPIMNLAEYVRTERVLMQCDAVLEGAADLAKAIARTGPSTYDVAVEVLSMAMRGAPLSTIRRKLLLLPELTISDEQLETLADMFVKSGLHESYGVTFDAYLNAVKPVIAYVRGL